MHVIVSAECLIDGREEEGKLLYDGTVYIVEDGGFHDWRNKYMSMAGLDGNEFYFQDNENKRITVFSMEDFSEESKGLPFDSLMIPEGKSRREVFVQQLLSSLRSLGESGEYALGQSLLLISLAKYWHEAKCYGNVLLLGEDESSPLAGALAKVMICFSLDSRVYCLKGEGTEKIGIGSVLLSLPQKLENLSLPDNSFSVVILSDRIGELSPEVLQKALAAVGAGGIVFCLSSSSALKDCFQKNCPQAERYSIGAELILYCQPVSEVFALRRDRLRYTGFAVSRDVSFVGTGKKKTVLFMPYMARHWEKMKLLYERLMKEKEHYTALLMPIPYGEKDEKGKAIQWHDEGKDFAQLCEVLDFKGVDIGALHPDVVVLDRPYSSHDKYAVEEKYYAEKLYNEAVKVICLSDTDDIGKCLRGGDVLQEFRDWRPIVLYGGTTKQAEKCYYRLNGAVSYFVNREAGESFHNKSVVTFKDIDDWDKYIIIVATDWNEYCQIKSDFKAKGLKEFCDFYYWEAFFKKVAVMHGNCYLNAYKELLERNNQFHKEYFIYPIPLIQDNKEKKIDEDLLSACDFYIHQDIRADNRFGYELSDEYIIPKLKKDCKVFTLPNLVQFADVFYPRPFISEINLKTFRRGRTETMFQGNKIIDDGFLSGKNVEGIIKDFLDVDIVSEEDKQRCKKTFIRKVDELKEREKNWDVKISDYILENYKTHKLFVDEIHPSKILMAEICRRIGDALNFDRIDEIHVDYNFEWHEMFIQPWVKQALDLKFSEKYIRMNNKIDRLVDDEIDLHEYVREYIYWKYDKFLE